MQHSNRLTGFLPVLGKMVATIGHLPTDFESLIDIINSFYDETASTYNPSLGHALLLALFLPVSHPDLDQLIPQTDPAEFIAKMYQDATEIILVQALQARRWVPIDGIAPDQFECIADNIMPALYEALKYFGFRFADDDRILLALYRFFCDTRFVETLLKQSCQLPRKEGVAHPFGYWGAQVEMHRWHAMATTMLINGKPQQSSVDSPYLFFKKMRMLADDFNNFYEWHLLDSRLCISLAEQACQACTTEQFLNIQRYVLGSILSLTNLSYSRPRTATTGDCSSSALLFYGKTLLKITQHTPDKLKDRQQIQEAVISKRDLLKIWLLLMDFYTDMQAEFTAKKMVDLADTLATQYLSDSDIRDFWRAVLSHISRQLFWTHLHDCNQLHQDGSKLIEVSTYQFRDEYEREISLTMHKNYLYLSLYYYGTAVQKLDNLGVHPKDITARLWRDACCYVAWLQEKVEQRIEFSYFKQLDHKRLMQGDLYDLPEITLDPISYQLGARCSDFHTVLLEVDAFIPTLYGENDPLPELKAQCKKTLSHTSIDDVRRAIADLKLISDALFAEKELHICLTHRFILSQGFKPRFLKLAGLYISFLTTAFPKYDEPTSPPPVSARLYELRILGMQLSVQVAIDLAPFRVALFDTLGHIYLLSEPALDNGIQHVLFPMLPELVDKNIEVLRLAFLILFRVMSVRTSLEHAQMKILSQKKVLAAFEHVLVDTELKPQFPSMCQHIINAVNKGHPFLMLYLMQLQRYVNRPDSLLRQERPETLKRLDYEIQVAARSMADKPTDLFLSGNVCDAMIHELALFSQSAVERLGYMKSDSGQFLTGILFQPIFDVLMCYAGRAELELSGLTDETIFEDFATLFLFICQHVDPIQTVRGGVLSADDKLFQFIYRRFAQQNQDPLVTSGLKKLKKYCFVVLLAKEISSLSATTTYRLLDDSDDLSGEVLSLLNTQHVRIVFSQLKLDWLPWCIEEELGLDLTRVSLGRIGEISFPSLMTMLWRICNAELKKEKDPISKSLEQRVIETKLLDSPRQHILNNLVERLLKFLPPMAHWPGLTHYQKRYIALLHEQYSDYFKAMKAHFKMTEPEDIAYCSALNLSLESVQAVLIRVINDAMVTQRLYMESKYSVLSSKALFSLSSLAVFNEVTADNFIEINVLTNWLNMSIPTDPTVLPLCAHRTNFYRILSKIPTLSWMSSQSDEMLIGHLRHATQVWPPCSVVEFEHLVRALVHIISALEYTNDDFREVDRAAVKSSLRQEYYLRYILVRNRVAPYLEDLFEYCGDHDAWHRVILTLMPTNMMQSFYEGQIFTVSDVIHFASDSIKHKHVESCLRLMHRHVCVIAAISSDNRPLGRRLMQSLNPVLSRLTKWFVTVLQNPEGRRFFKIALSILLSLFGDEIQGAFQAHEVSKRDALAKQLSERIEKNTVLKPVWSGGTFCHYTVQSGQRLRQLDFVNLYFLFSDIHSEKKLHLFPTHWVERYTGMEFVGLALANIAIDSPLIQQYEVLSCMIGIDGVNIQSLAAQYLGAVLPLHPTLALDADPAQLFLWTMTTESQALKDIVISFLASSSVQISQEFVTKLSMVLYRGMSVAETKEVFSSCFACWQKLRNRTGVKMPDLELMQAVNLVSNVVRLRVWSSLPRIVTLLGRHGAMVLFPGHPFWLEENILALQVDIFVNICSSSDEEDIVAYFSVLDRLLLKMANQNQSIRVKQGIACQKALALFKKLVAWKLKNPHEGARLTEIYLFWLQAGAKASDLKEYLALLYRRIFVTMMSQEAAHHLVDAGMLFAALLDSPPGDKKQGKQKKQQKYTKLMTKTIKLCGLSSQGVAGDIDPAGGLCARLYDGYFAMHFPGIDPPDPRTLTLAEVDQLPALLKEKKHGALLGWLDTPAGHNIFPRSGVVAESDTENTLSAKNLGDLRELYATRYRDFCISYDKWLTTGESDDAGRVDALRQLINIGLAVQAMTVSDSRAAYQVLFNSVRDFQIDTFLWEERVDTRKGERLPSGVFEQGKHTYDAWVSKPGHTWKIPWRNDCVAFYERETAHSEPEDSDSATSSEVSSTSDQTPSISGSPELERPSGAAAMVSLSVDDLEALQGFVPHIKVLLTCAAKDLEDLAVMLSAVQKPHRKGKQRAGSVVSAVAFYQVVPTFLFALLMTLSDVFGVLKARGYYKHHAILDLDAAFTHGVLCVYLSKPEKFLAVCQEVLKYFQGVTSQSGCIITALVSQNLLNLVSSCETEIDIDMADRRCHVAQLARLSYSITQETFPDTWDEFRQRRVRIEAAYTVIRVIRKCYDERKGGWKKNERRCLSGLAWDRNEQRHNFHGTEKALEAMYQDDVDKLLHFVKQLMDVFCSSGDKPSLARVFHRARTTDVVPQDPPSAVNDPDGETVPQ